MDIEARDSRYRARICDDVRDISAELALLEEVFNKYPSSQKLRAAAEALVRDQGNMIVLYDIGRPRGGDLLSITANKRRF